MDRLFLKNIDFPILFWMVVVHLMAVPAFFYMSWESVIVFLILNFITNCLGITLGYHRLLSHRSYKTTKFLTRFFSTCGALALQNGPLHWSGQHRKHHGFSDRSGDPHDSRRGFWYSHMLWIFLDNNKVERKQMMRLTRDLQADTYLLWLDRYRTQIALQVLLGVLLYAVGGFEWFFWGGPFRLVFGYHSTWLVNSASHLWGYKRWQTKDQSRNNLLVAVLTWGEGWHNTHHAFGSSARHGLAWWEIDVTYYLIWGMKKLGFAWDVQLLPSNAMSYAANERQEFAAKFQKI